VQRHEQVPSLLQMDHHLPLQIPQCDLARRRQPFFVGRHLLASPFSPFYDIGLQSLRRLDSSFG
jgi:hypothetical protein